MASMTKPFRLPPPLLLLLKEVAFRQWCEVGAQQKLGNSVVFRLSTALQGHMLLPPG